MEWSDLFAALPAGAILLDAAGAIQAINPAAEQLLGLAAADWLGRAGAPFVPAAAGERFAWGDLVLRVAFAEIGSQRLVTYQDRTAQERERRQLLQWMRTELVFELRAPLYSVAATLKMLLSPPADFPIDGPSFFLNLAHKSLDRTVDLMDDMRALIDMEQDFEYKRLHLALEPYDLNEYLSRVFDSLAESFANCDIRLEIAISADVPPVAVDRAKIDRALHRLISFLMPSWKPGVLLASAQCHEPEWVTITLGPVGVSAADDERNSDTDLHQARSWIAHNLSPFHNTGLDLARRSIELHGGELQIKSGAQGIAFCFTLPIQSPERDEAPGAGPDSRQLIADSRQPVADSR